MRRKPPLACRFFVSESGNEPVREWLKDLKPGARKEIGSDLHVVQWRWPIGKPLVDGLGHGLFELRSSNAGDIYRVFFCIVDSTIVLLHAFQKKTQKTPKSDLNLAKKRKSALEADE